MDEENSQMLRIMGQLDAICELIATAIAVHPAGAAIGSVVIAKSKQLETATNEDVMPAAYVGGYQHVSVALANALAVRELAQEIAVTKLTGSRH